MLVKILIAGFCLVAASACSLQKGAEEAIDATKDMNEKMSDLDKKIGQTNDTTGALKTDMTFDISHSRMMAHLDRLFLEDSRSHSGLNPDPDLFADAAFVIQAMFFQFWRGQAGESVADLDERLDKGAELLFVRLFKHVPRAGGIDVLKPNSSYQGVAALGAKLDELHSRHADGLKRAGLPRKSLYDYVVEALRNRHAAERKEQMPRTITQILLWEKEVTYALQLRHNIYPLMVVARISGFQDRDILGRAWAGLMGMKDQTTLAQANPEQLREWTRWLNKAAQTRQDLRAVGIKPEYNQMIARIVAKVDFGQKAILANATPDARGMLLRDFTEAYERVAKESRQPTE